MDLSIHLDRRTNTQTSFVPDKEQYNFTRSQLLAQLDVAMGGRVAEEIVYGIDQVTTGECTRTSLLRAFFVFLALRLLVSNPIHFSSTPHPLLINSSSTSHPLLIHSSSTLHLLFIRSSSTPHPLLIHFSSTPHPLFIHFSSTLQALTPTFPKPPPLQPPWSNSMACLRRCVCVTSLYINQTSNHLTPINTRLVDWTTLNCFSTTKTFPSGRDFIVPFQKFFSDDEILTD